MGIILKNLKNEEITYFLKGADVIITKMVKYSDWLSEECILKINKKGDNLARSGLRTLVFAKKIIKNDEFLNWEKKYKDAKSSIQNRNQNIENIRSLLEIDMDLIGVTGIFKKKY
jgi:phospholipid-translocating ATPase